MGFFKQLIVAAGNWLEIKNLDNGSDLHISNICGFEVLGLESRIRRLMSDEVRRLCVSNLGEPYTVEEIALYKLTHYSRLAEQSLGAESSEFKQIQSGIKKILNSSDKFGHPEISLDARIELRSW